MAEKQTTQMKKNRILFASLTIFVLLFAWHIQTRWAPRDTSSIRTPNLAPPRKPLGLTQSPPHMMPATSTNAPKMRMLHAGAHPAVNRPTLAATSALLTAPDQELSQSVLRQIHALQEEKAARTLVEQKIASKLLDAGRMQRGQPIADGLTKLRVKVDSDSEGRVLVDIKARVTDDLLTEIAALDGKVVNSFAQYDAIRAWVPLPQMNPLASREEVTFIRPAAKASFNAGSVDSEGDTTHRAIGARSTYAVSGAGVKVGVLSDSVDFLSQSQASGNLENVTVLSGQGGSGAGEGTAMLEIIHDLAPGATLFFATAFDGPTAFANNIRALRNQGCDIIVDDVGYFNESPFQDGVIAQAVNDVTASGALYFSSAGNAGHADRNQSGTWEGDFFDGGTNSLIQGRIHRFGGAPYNTITDPNSISVDLFWSDPLGAAGNDYDLYLLDASGTVVLDRSDDSQTGLQDPYETLSSAVNADERLVVVLYSGASRFLHLDTEGGRLAVATQGNTRGHACATNAFCVAAVGAPQVYPNAFVSGSSNPVEYFSSDGPRRVFFDVNGIAITPGNFSSTGGSVRPKPDLAAADGVSTSVPGFESFYGTSAAAPHAAAIAALLKSSNPTLTPNQMRNALTSTALDIEGLGWDRDSGYGIVMAGLVLAAVPHIPQVDHFTWSTIASTQTVNGPFVATVTAQDEANATVTNFTGTLALNGLVAGGLATNIIPGSLSPSGTDSGGGYTDGYAFTPNADIRVTHVRHYYGKKVSIWTDTGVLLASQNVVSVPGTWVETPLATPITLSHGIPYRVGVTYPAGTAFYWSTNFYHLFADGTNGLSYFAIGDDFPAIRVATPLKCLVGLRYTVASFLPFAVSPSGSGPCVNGIWTGNVTVPQAGTNMLLKADDGSGHSGLSNPFTVAAAGSSLPLITGQPQSLTTNAGASVTFSVVAGGSAPLGYFWQRTGAFIAGATGSSYTLSNVQVSDSGTQFTCLVSNALGTVTSSPATLTVVAPVPPVVQPGGLQHFGNGQFQFTFTGTAGSAYEIQVSTDLLTWQPLALLTLTNGTTTNFLDTPTNVLRRFYRVKLVGP
ncbi:MAG: hypothetical protein JWR69_2762 [Pedosphaera sp.]|nr:hypothetical protein [Pedosphaera sp.]